MKEKGTQGSKGVNEYGKKPKVLRGAITQTPAQKRNISERVQTKNIRESKV